MTDTNTLAPTDAEILALNAGEVHFSESPSKYPAAGFGTQYHAGAPGVLSFARAVLAAKWGTHALASQPDAAPVGMEPVATVLFSSTGWRNLVDALASMEDGIKLYTAAQMQAMLAAVPRNAPLYSPDDVAFPVQRSAEGVDVPPELASTARPTSIAAAEVAVPIKAGEYPALVCDYCGALTPDPWHSSGMLHGKMSKHIHSCDACETLKATQASPVDANVQEDAARWREHVEKLDALVAYCPTCCQGFIAKQAMTRDEVLFACGKAVGQSGAKRLREALDLAVDHIDMDALRISHCKDAAVIDAAMNKGGAA